MDSVYGIEIDSRDVQSAKNAKRQNPNTQIQIQNRSKNL
jgi:tRNA/tmRNA/rRNA uracil-C5-methylase (TrmA/RlmC/RlmD family)